MKSTWGSQATRLNRDSFLAFAACRLCLLPSRSPVACAANGDIFCRECAMNNLLAQRKEMKRLEKEEARRQAESVEDEARMDEEARARAIEDFEKVQAGVAIKLGGGTSSSSGGRKVIGRRDGKILVEDEAQPENGAARGTKRKFELDEDELLRIARDERSRAKQALQEEKSEAARTRLPSFWVPSLTPSSNTAATLHHAGPAHKQQPVCPGSSKSKPHSYTLKTLITVNFSEEVDSATGAAVRMCPSCKKALNNGAKAVLARPCGHVLCKPCVAQFMRDAEPPDPHAPGAAGHKETHAGGIRCYVCDGHLADGAGQGKEKEKDKDKDRLRPGLVELSSEGTGFAGAGKNVVEREGVAFQC